MITMSFKINHAFLNASFGHFKRRLVKPVIRLDANRSFLSSLLIINKRLQKQLKLRLPDVPDSRGQSPNAYFCSRLNSVPEISPDFNKSPDYFVFQILFHILKCNTA